MKDIYIVLIIQQIFIVVLFVKNIKAKKKIVTKSLEINGFEITTENEQLSIKSIK